MYFHDVQDFAQTYHPEWDREQGMHMDYSVELSIDLHSPGLGEGEDDDMPDFVFV